jgi:hypothetical protein
MTTSVLDSVVIALTGKRIALLGQRESGKTRFHRIIHGLPDEPLERTPYADPMGKARNREMKLAVKPGYDFAGAEVGYYDWAAEVREATLVFYLFDAYKLRQEPEYEERFRKDAKKISEWNLAGKELYLIGTHADVDPEYSRLGLAGYSDLILGLPAVAVFRDRLPVKRAEVGSLINYADVAEMVRRLLSKR